MSSQSDKLNSKREQILRSCIHIIAEKGIENVTMEHIATDLQMTKGSLYYYFKNKEDLIITSHELILSDSIEAVQNSIQQSNSSTEKLKKAILFHVQFLIHYSNIYDLIVKPENIFPKNNLQRILQKRKEYEQTFDTIIKEGIDRDEFHVRNVKIIRMIILGAMNWIQQWYSPTGTFTEYEIAEMYSEYLLKLLK